MSKKQSSQATNTFKKSRLNCRAILTTERAKHFQTLAIGVWIRRGSRDEPKQFRGIAHFLEHMLFNGTDKRSALQIAQEVDKVGGDFNAMTSREYTCFYIILPVEHLRFALELLAEILLESKFTKEDVEKEHKVILQELYSVEENPEEYIHDRLMERVFPNHSLGHDILGDAKSLAKINCENLRKFFKSHYVGENMVISLAGDIAHLQVKNKLNKLLKDLPQRGISYKPKSRRKPVFKPGIHCLLSPMEQTHLEVAFPAPTIDSKDRVAAFLLNAFIGGGMSSSLFQSIREQNGLAYNIYSSLIPFSDTGLISIYLATSHEHLRKCLDILKKEIIRFCEEKVSDNDLEIVKGSVKSAILLSGDSMEARMTALAKSELFHRKHLSNKEICKLIDDVTSTQMRRLAKNMFSHKPIVTLFGKNRIKSADLAYQPKAKLK